MARHSVQILTTLLCLCLPYHSINAAQDTSTIPGTDTTFSVTSISSTSSNTVTSPTTSPWQYTSVTTQTTSVTSQGVVNLTVPNKTTSSVFLTWNAPTGSFTVQWTDGSVNNSTNTSNTYYNVTGLTAGVNYTFTVTAVVADSQTTRAQTQISTFTNPNVVTNLTVSNKITTSVSLTWNEPNGNRSYFTVQWTDVSGNKSINTSTTSYTATGLTAGVKYTFTVTAVAADNQTTGAPIQISAFTQPDVIKNLAVSDKTTTSVSLTWNEPNGNRSYFTVQWTDVSGNNSISISTPSYTATGLTAGVKYTFTVTAVAADNQTTGTPTQIPTFTKPDAVSSLTVSTKTISVYLMWNEPNGNRSYFIVQWTDGNAINNTNISTPSYNVTGLTAGVKYTFTVTAVAADHQTTGAPTTTTAFTNPDVLSNLAVSSKTTLSVSLTWNEPSGNRSYFKVQWTDGSVNSSINISTPSYTVTGLTPGVNYTFTVTAVAADNQTAGASSQISAFTNPNLVTNLIVSIKTTSSVSLTWNEPNGSRSYFTVQCTDGSVNNSINTANTSYTVTGLTAGVKYTFTVTAVAADNQTAGASTQISAFTNPNVVTSLIVSNKTTSSVSLTWNEPKGNRSYFTVQWADVSINTPNTSYTVTGLTAGVKYTFNVTAAAADNLTIGASTQISSFTQPNVVTNLTVSNKTTTSVSLKWNEPNGNRSYFIVQWTDVSVVNNSTNISTTSYTVTGLTAGVKYTFTVTAVAADNETTGAPTQISAFTYPDVVTSLTVYNKTTSSVSLTWTEPPGNKSWFILRWTDGSVKNSTNTSIPSYTVTGLTAGIKYTFTVTAYAGDGQSEGAPFQISAFTNPDVVNNLNVSDKTTSSVSLKWNEPNGSRSYFIVQCTDGNAINSTNISTPSYTVTGLTAGVKYTFTVIAVAADNQTTGAPTQISAFTYPKTVSNLAVSDKTTTSVSLTWNEPNGRRSYFTVQWTDGSVINSTNNSNTSYTVTGLTAGVNYTFIVTAAAADNQTIGGPTQISAFTQPDVIRNLSVNEITSRSLYLNWTEPIGERSFFEVQWRNDNITLNSMTSNTFYNITNLNPGVSYTILISAVAADNITEGGTITRSVYTKPDTVLNLTTVNVTTSSMLLYWIQAMGKISYYVIQYDNFSTNISISTELTMINITNLTPGVQYTFKVFAVVADNKTAGNSSYVSAFTKPDVVRDLNVTEITISSLYLNWTEPIGKISFFKVQWRNDSITLNSPTFNTFYNITNLNPGVSYTILISAVAADNITEGGTITRSVYTKPDTVLNLTAVNVTTSSILLYWIQAMGKISYYVIQYDNFSTNISISTELTMINITNLTPGVQYTFKVFAVVADNKTAGNSSYVSAFTKPDVVRDLNVTEITISSLYLNWTEPIGKISFFKVQWRNDSITLNSPTFNTFYNITNLNPGVSYTILISAVAADNITEGGTITRSVYTKPDTVLNLTAVNVTTSSMLLYWIQAMGKISYYVIQYDNFSTNISISTELTMINITNLTPGVQYTFKVFAVVADNKTAGNSSYVSAFTKPDVVRDLNVTEITISSLFLNWTEPIGKRSFFNVQWRNDSITSTFNTFYNITNLNPGVSYTILISAVAADNITEGGAITRSVYTKPGIVRNLRTSEVTKTSVFLIWTEPVGKLSFYRVQWINSSTTSTTSLNITGLTPGTNYTFTVSAVAADNKTEGPVGSLSICTGTSPTIDIECAGPNRTAAALLNLKWMNPSGINQGFNISLNPALSIFVPSCNPVCNYNISNNLQYFHTYNLTISTLGCGGSGTWDFNCRTGITDPPVPTTPEEVLIQAVPVSQTALTLQFSSSLLNSANGPIEAYGVLLSTDPQSNSSKAFLRLTYNDWLQDKTKTYLTLLKLNSDIITRDSMITVEIGNNNGSDSRLDYKNGELKYQEYRTALVLFTSLQIKDRLVDPVQSICSVTPFSKSIAKPLESQILPIVLGVLLPIILILIIIITVLVIQKKRITKKYTDIPVNNLRSKISIPVRVEEFEAYFKKQQLDSNCGFAEQYEDLKVVGTAQTKNSALAMENKVKNRYNNVLPYDSSRVKLSIHGSPFDDYINANYISGYNSKKEYIAAQGPLPATVNEFWRMIWEKNAHTIVMLTKCYEQGRVKCEKYWPGDNKLYNNILVTTTSEIELEDWTIRDFIIKNVKTAETRDIRQFHFTAWPDHGVPETTEVLINFRHLVREHMDNFSRNAPAVVHCSAGVGRTGTLIALDHMIFQIERESMVDIYGIIYNMRMHRPLMVQTEDQYVFLNQCASDIIKSRMGTNVDLIYQNAAAFSIYENVQR